MMCRHRALSVQELQSKQKRDDQFDTVIACSICMYIYLYSIGCIAIMCASVLYLFVHMHVSSTVNWHCLELAFAVRLGGALVCQQAEL
jgi:hypothetical protein